MPKLFSNNAAAFLTSTIGPAATELTIEPAKATLFPVLNSGDWGAPANWQSVTLEDEDGNTEVIYVGLHADGSPILSNLLRGQEGTTARTWTAGLAIVENRLTKADIEAVISYGFGARAAISTNTANFNTITAGGVYPLTGDDTWAGSANGPTLAAANGQLEVFASSGFAVVQEVHAFNPPTMWRRSKIASTWTAWKRVDAIESLKSTVGTWINDFNNVARLFFTNAGATILKGYGAAPFSVQNAAGSTVLQVSSTGVLTSGADALASGDLTRLGQVLAAIKQAVPPGKPGWFYDTVAPDGWVEARPDHTIGSAASGATRANADTADLYAKVWAVTSNVITTSTGAATTRGASAAADFAANKRLALPELRAVFIRGLDNGRGTDPGRTLGSEQQDDFEAHSHDQKGLPSTTGSGTGGGGVFMGSGSVGVSTGTTGGTETRPLNIALLACWKL